MTYNASHSQLRAPALLQSSAAVVQTCPSGISDHRSRVTLQLGEPQRSFVQAPKAPPMSFRFKQAVIPVRITNRRL